MWTNRSIALFVVKFAVIFGFLIFPWPNFDNWYAAFFRSIAAAVFTHETGNLLVEFQSHSTVHDFTVLQTEMLLGNRTKVDSSGKGVGQAIQLDTRSIGWIPTALVTTLILASPVSPRRRALALLGGLVLVQFFILVTIQIRIWDELPQLSLATFSPIVGRVLSELDYALLTQLGASFSVPIIVWILVTFASCDAAALPVVPKTRKARVH